MLIRILSEHSAVEGKPGDIVEADAADPAIAGLMAAGYVEPADAVPPAEPAPAIDPPALPPQPAGKK